MFKVVFVNFMLSSSDETMHSLLLEKEIASRYSANEV